MADDPEDDAIAAGRVGEAGHGASWAPHFPEASFQGMGGAHLAPGRLGKREEVEQCVPVALQAGPGAGTQRPPLLRPAAVDAQGLAAAGGRLDRRRFLQARTFLLGHLVGDIAQLGRPAGLRGDVGIEQRQRRL